MYNLACRRRLHSQLEDDVRALNSSFISNTDTYSTVYGFAFVWMRLKNGYIMFDNNWILYANSYEFTNHAKCVTGANKYAFVNRYEFQNDDFTVSLTNVEYIWQRVVRISQRYFKMIQYLGGEWRPLTWVWWWQ